MADASFHAPNYSDRGPNVIACATILVVIPTITVFIRLWSRVVASRIRFWWDDYMLLATLICSHVYLAMVLWCVSLGLGKHTWMIPLKNLKPTLISQNLQTTFYGLATCLMRLSALTLYARIFRVSSVTKMLLWGLGGIVAAWCVCVMVVPWTNCHPLAKTINPALPGTCDVRTKWFVGSGVISFLLDVIILLTPMPMVWRLNLGTKKKVFVTITLALGYASAILSLTRLVMIARKPTILSGKPESDASWVLVPMLYVSSLEAPFGIVALCGPPMNQLFRRAHSFGWRSLLTTKNYSSNVTSQANFHKPLAFDRRNEKRSKARMNRDPWDIEESATTSSELDTRRDDARNVELQAFKYQGAGFARI